MKLASWILDHYDMLEAEQIPRDELEKVAKRFNGHIMSPSERARQSDNDYGLVLINTAGAKARKFPINTRFDAYMSKVCSVSTQKQLPEGARNVLSDRLDQASRHFNLPIHSSKLTKTASFVPVSLYVLKSDEEAKLDLDRMAKKASQEKYAICESLNGTSMYKYPIDTAEQVKRRIDRFEVIHNRMHAKYAFQYADNVAERAEELNVDVPEDSMIMLYKNASLNPRFKSYVADRIEVAPDAAKVSYMGLQLKEASATPRQLAIAMDTLDRNCGMDMLYETQFPDPAHSTLTLEKKAESVEIGTTVVDINQLKGALKNNPDQFLNFLQPEVIESLQESPKEILRSLPIPFQQKIIETLNTQSQPE